MRHTLKTYTRVLNSKGRTYVTKNNSRISHNTQISLRARAVVRLSLRHVEIRKTRVDSLLRSLMMVSTLYGVSSHATRARDSRHADERGARTRTQPCRVYTEPLISE